MRNNFIGGHLVSDIFKDLEIFERLYLLGSKPTAEKQRSYITKQKMKKS